jgi:olefin beta-lactone synthetase
MNANILERLYQACQTYPNKIAIHGLDQSITFSELESCIKSRAKILINKGLKKGDCVLLFIPMGIPLYIEVCAIFHIGAIAVFIDQWVDKKRLIQSCEIANCRAIIASKKVLFLASFYKTIFKIPKKISVERHFKKLLKVDCDICQVSENDAALITFTTGSTGIPKAPIRTHGLLNAQFEALLPLLNQTDKARIDMPFLPIVLLLNLGIGRTSIIANFNPLKPETFDAQKIFAQIKNHQVTSITASPFYLNALCDYNAQQTNNIKLNQVVSGGGPIFPSLAKKMVTELSNDATIVFGSTEAEPMTHDSAAILANTYNDISKGLYVGKAHSAWQIKIIQWQAGALDHHYIKQYACDRNKAGEIIVCGKHVLQQYFNNEDAFKNNKIVDANGNIWHRTGDMAYLDEQNNLFLLGRCRQVIQTKLHGNIYPFIMEALLQDIVGIKHGTILKLNNKIYCIITCLANVNQSEILTSIKSRFPYIEECVILDILPFDKRHHTKIDYDKLDNEINHYLKK